ncbi:MAG: hypothetical protein QM631_13140 [Dysgonomonas sp.]
MSGTRYLRQAFGNISLEGDSTHNITWLYLEGDNAYTANGTYNGVHQIQFVPVTDVKLKFTATAGNFSLSSVVIVKL